MLYVKGNISRTIERERTFGRIRDFDLVVPGDKELYARRLYPI